MTVADGRFAISIASCRAGLLNTMIVTEVPMSKIEVFKAMIDTKISAFHGKYSVNAQYHLRIITISFSVGCSSMFTVFR